MQFLLAKILALLVLLLPLALYLLTLAPTYIPIDSAEFSLCIAFWGICHPPGFPLYVVIAKIFTSLFPFGSLIYKANLLSAVFAALTVFIVYLVLLAIGVRRLIAFSTAILLAVASIFWEFTIAADVFSFATFLLATMLWLVFGKRKFLAFFVLGLSASHFYITAVLFPVLVWYFWPQVPTAAGPGARIKAKIFDLVKVGLVFVLAFFPQLIMFWRMQQNPVINWGHAQDFSGFIGFLQRKEFGSFFLLANPVLTFSLIKFFKHFYIYFANLATNFGLVLPAFAAVAIIWGKLLVKRQVLFLFISFWLIIFIQLLLLSTIDPTGANNPFQIGKFYLLSFIFAAILIAVAFDYLVEKLFASQIIYAVILMAILPLLSLAVNWKSHNFSQNYFSQNLVDDALGQLPPASVGITVSHLFYFGSLYEQLINQEFTNLTLLYFPNEKNRDNEKYQPALFAKPVDEQFVNQVQKGKILGKAENYVLETIARNLDQPIYILQGSFEQGFFAYLKPYLYPHGLWWKVEPVVNTQYDPILSATLFSQLKNREFSKANLHQRQQQDEAITYAIAYYSTAIALASQGAYDQALAFLERSLAINPNAQNIQGEIDLIAKTKNLEAQKEKLIGNQDRLTLLELGNNYYTLGNFDQCINVFNLLVSFAPDDAKNYNNLASCYASLGKKEEARINYQKALSLDPDLELAKKGLQTLLDNR